MPRAFLYALAGLNAALALAGAILAARRNIPSPVAIPIVLAFCLQISFYLLPGVPAARRWMENRFSPHRLAVLGFLAGIVPYLVYSVPTGVFHPVALLKLAMLCAVIVFVFVLWPVKRLRLSWQDVAVLVAVGVAELGRVFHQIYASPVADVRLEVLGRFMIIGLGSMAFLSLRRLEGTGYQFRMTWADWKSGVKQFLFSLPLAIAVGWGTGFAAYRPMRAAPWMWAVLAPATFLGIYLVVALFEEFFFRGVVQNLLSQTLGRPLAAQAVASVLFGLSHVGRRSFPNWRFVIVGTILGWFYGQAYRERRSVVAASVTHALVVTVWRLFFSG